MKISWKKLMKRINENLWINNWEFKMLKFAISLFYEMRRFLL